MQEALELAIKSDAQGDSQQLLGLIGSKVHDHGWAESAIDYLQRTAESGLDKVAASRLTALVMITDIHCPERPDKLVAFVEQKLAAVERNVLAQGGVQPKEEDDSRYLCCHMLLKLLSNANTLRAREVLESIEKDNHGNEFEWLARQNLGMMEKRSGGLSP